VRLESALGLGIHYSIVRIGKPSPGGNTNADVRVVLHSSNKECWYDGERGNGGVARIEWARVPMFSRTKQVENLG